MSEQVENKASFRSRGRIGSRLPRCATAAWFCLAVLTSAFDACQAVKLEATRSDLVATSLAIDDGNFCADIRNASKDLEKQQLKQALKSVYEKHDKDFKAIDESVGPRPKKSWIEALQDILDAECTLTARDRAELKALAKNCLKSAEEAAKRSPRLKGLESFFRDLAKGDKGKNWSRVSDGIKTLRQDSQLNWYSQSQLGVYYPNDSVRCDEFRKEFGGIDVKTPVAISSHHIAFDKPASAKKVTGDRFLQEQKAAQQRLTKLVEGYKPLGSRVGKTPRALELKSEKEDLQTPVAISSHRIAFG